MPAMPLPTYTGHCGWDKGHFLAKPEQVGDKTVAKPMLASNMYLVHKTYKWTICQQAFRLVNALRRTDEVSTTEAAVLIWLVIEPWYILMDATMLDEAFPD